MILDQNWNALALIGTDVDGIGHPSQHVAPIGSDQLESDMEAESDDTDTAARRPYNFKKPPLSAIGLLLWLRMLHHVIMVVIVVVIVVAVVVGFLHPLWITSALAIIYSAIVESKIGTERLLLSARHTLQKCVRPQVRQGSTRLEWICVSLSQ